MKNKLLLFLVFISFIGYSQNPLRADYGIKIRGGQPTVSSVNFLTTTDNTSEGLQGKIAPINLPIPYSPINYSTSNQSIGQHLTGIDTRLGEISSTNVINALDLKTTLSAGAFSGFDVTDNGNGTINVSSGVAYLRATNDPYAPLVKYNISAYSNIPLVDNTTNYIVVSYNGGSPALVLNTTGAGIDTQTSSIAIVAARVGTTIHYISLVGSNADPNAKLRIRYLVSEPITRGSGLAISATGLKLITTSGSVFSGILRFTVPAFNTNTGSTFTRVHNTGGSTWNRLTGQTDINNTQYNNAGTLTTLGVNKYRTDFVYMLINNPNKLYVIMGDVEYGSLLAAQAAPKPASVPVELQTLGVLIGRVCVKKDDTTLDVASPFNTVFQASGIPSHNDLAGLQGGTAGEYNHLTNAQVTKVNGSEQTSNKQNSLAEDGTGTKYTTVDAVNSALGLKVNGTNASDFYRNIYYMGDSLTDDGTYIYAISSVLGNTWYNYNYGRSGDNTTGMLARFSTDILSKNNPSHVVILGGTNDITNGTSATVIQSNLQQMYTDAHNAGLTVIAVTITPRTTTAPQLAVQQAVNAWIKTTAINVDYVIDPYVTLADPSNPTQLLPAYSADGLHMTIAGYTALGNYIASNVTWVAKENNSNLKIDIKGYASANQSLNTDSNPIFNTVNNITVGSGTGNVYTNTAIGRQALNVNTYGRYNTSIGNQSLLNNTAGHSNTAIGHQSLQNNTTGFVNIGIGYQPLNSNTTGTNNVGIGSNSLFSNTTGIGNIGIGSNALRSASTLSNLIAIGSSAMLNSIGATNTVAIGTNALQNNTTGSNIVAIGTNVLTANTTGNGNIGIGYLALGTNITGGANIGIGQSSLFNTKGGTNVAIGSNSLLNNTTGSDNLALGLNAGAFLADGTTGLGISNNSLFLGGGTKALINNTSNEIVIGWNATGFGSNTVTIGNNSIVSTHLKGQVRLASAKIETTPTTSAGTYSILTLNTVAGSTLGNIENIPSTTFAPNLLTGYVSGAGTVSETDTVLQAIQKLNGNTPSQATFSPTVSAETNLTSTTVSGNYTVNNGLVTAYVRISSNITNASTASSFNITLPVSRTSTSTLPPIGSGSIGGGVILPVKVKLSTSGNNLATINFVSGAGSGVVDGNVSFQYRTTE